MLFSITSHILAGPQLNTKNNPASSSVPSSATSGATSSASFQSLPSNTSYISALSGYLQAQSKRHAYGHLYVRGATQSIEFFRLVIHFFDSLDMGLNSRCYQRFSCSVRFFMV